MIKFKYGEDFLIGITLSVGTLLIGNMISNGSMPLEKTTATVTNIDGMVVTTDKGVFKGYNSELKNVFNLSTNKQYDIVSQKILFGIAGSQFKSAAPVCQ